MAGSNEPRGNWPKAIVEQTFPDRHGLVRKVTLRGTTGTYSRDIRKLCRLELAQLYVHHMHCLCCHFS